MNDEARTLLLAICGLQGISWALVAREALKRAPAELERLAAGEISEISRDAEKTRHALLNSGAELADLLHRAEDAIADAARIGARLVTVLDDEYPANLRLIHNLPPFLFVRGAMERDDARSVAVVGTRDASEDGLRRAAKMAHGLAGAGVTVVSGLASGIDTAAHRATLDEDARTVAVVGTGILRTYPAENAELVERIVERGAVVSQFWPRQHPAQHTFPRRNVVMSGIVQGSIVVEASRTSGAKMQARLALEHGKRVFLMRSLVTDQPWARAYLERGAIEVSSVDDVLDQLRTSEQIEGVASARRQLTLDVV